MNYDDEIRRADMMVDEDELRALFLRRRPDAGRFAAGVAKRLRRSAEDSAGQGTQHRLHRAASWLPLDGGLLFLHKSWWSLISLPVLLLIGSIAALLAAGAMIRASLQGGIPARGGTIPPRTAGGFTPGWTLFTITANVAPLLAFMVFLAAGGQPIVDAALLMVLVSTIGLVVMVRHEARAGRAQRSQVAALCLGLLQALFLLGFVWFQGPGGAEGEWTRYCPFVLCAGILLLLPLVPGQRIATLLLVAVALLVLGGMERPTQPPVDAIHRAVAEFRAEPSDPLGWQDTASFVDALRAMGHEVELPSAVHRGIEQAIDPMGPVDMNLWSAAARMKILSSAQWQRLAARREARFLAEQLLEKDGPLQLSASTVFALPLLMSIRELDAGQVEHLVQRLDQSWPKVADHGALENAWICVLWLEWLDRPEIIAGRREVLHRLLAAHQVTNATYAPGGFTPQQGVLGSSERQATHAAIELMARVGAPKDLDLRALHRFLRQESRSLPDASPFVRRHRLLPFADLLWLQEIAPEPSRDLAMWIVEERLFLAIVGIVLLCLHAARIAPPRPLVTQGALP